MINRCNHAYAHESGKVGCKLGLFGGIPHIGVCATECGHYRGPALTSKKKTSLVANPELVEARKRICMTCARNMGVNLVTVKCQSCKSCGNNLSLSTGICPENKWASVENLNVPTAKEFKHVVVVNLKRRRDRLENFNERISKLTWSMAKPIVFPAVDGTYVNPPEWFKAGRGAWGCYRSHACIIESAMNEKVNLLAIFEDDAMFVDDFDAKLYAYLKALPNDWEQAYLGGQLLKKNEHPPEQVNEHVIRPFNINRTHAYLLRGGGIAKVYEQLMDTATWQRDFPEHHVDHRLGKLHESGKINVYAPAIWLVGQNGGESSVNGRRIGATYYT